MGTERTDDIKPWDSDHTALVHVLWDAERKGLLSGRYDELASHIMQSKWLRAIRLDEWRNGPEGGSMTPMDLSHLSSEPKP